MKNPCYKCADREVGCHSKCDKYKAWAKEEYALKEALYATRKKTARTYPISAEKHFKNDMREV